MQDQATTPERGRQRDILNGAQVLSGQLGKTIQRLRKAYNLSLSELAEQSGVAKSIISQIERNETNPTLATIWRLSQALDVSIERVLATSDEEPFIEKTSRADTPILLSDDGKIRLAIVGWIKTVEWLQWYEVTADPGGVLDSDPHQRGSVESLTVTEGSLEVEVAGTFQRARGGRDFALSLRQAAHGALRRHGTRQGDHGRDHESGGDGVGAPSVLARLDLRYSTGSTATRRSMPGIDPADDVGEHDAQSGIETDGGVARLDLGHRHARGEDAGSDHLAGAVGNELGRDIHHRFARAGRDVEGTDLADERVIGHDLVAGAAH